jgi:hypothetical protein
MRLVKEVQVKDSGHTLMLAQYSISPPDSWKWTEGPTVRRLRYEIRMGLYEWVGDKSDMPEWWEDSQ